MRGRLCHTHAAKHITPVGVGLKHTLVPEMQTKQHQHTQHHGDRRSDALASRPGAKYVCVRACVSQCMAAKIQLDLMYITKKSICFRSADLEYTLSPISPLSIFVPNFFRRRIIGLSPSSSSAPRPACTALNKMSLGRMVTSELGPCLMADGVVASGGDLAAACTHAGRADT